METAYRLHHYQMQKKNGPAAGRVRPKMGGFKKVRALIRPVLEYGHMAIVNTNNTNKKRLQTIQNEFLRICCGAARGTPVYKTNVGKSIFTYADRVAA